MHYLVELRDHIFDGRQLLYFFFFFLYCFFKQPFLYFFFFFIFNTEKSILFHAGEENTLTITINIIILLHYILIFTFLSRINSSNLVTLSTVPTSKWKQENLFIYFKIRSLFPVGETEEQNSSFSSHFGRCFDLCVIANTVSVTTQVTKIAAISFY